MAITLDGTAGITYPDGNTQNDALQATGLAPVYGCRAWVNFDATKDTTGAVSTANTNRLIRASGNVTSVLRNSVGNFTINFTTAMLDGNYSVVVSSIFGTGSSFGFCIESTPAAGSVVIGTRNTSNAAGYDPATVCVSIFR